MSFEATIKRAFKYARQSREQAGLPMIRKPPARYKVTLWLSPGEYVDFVETARMRGQSVTATIRSMVTGNWVPKAKKMKLVA